MVAYPYRASAASSAGHRHQRRMTTICPFPVPRVIRLYNSMETLVRTTRPSMQSNTERYAPFREPNPILANAINNRDMVRIHDFVDSRLVHTTESS